MQSRIDIPALTGMRFVAAALVLISHLTWGLPNSLVTRLMEDCATDGMGLFFVLSGFVMWLNYARAIAAGRPGALYDFAVARFARLYPMYLAVTLVAIGAALALYGWPTVK